jgi:hypothetical protein
MKKLAVLTIILALVSESCSRYYYVANVQNVPMFKEKDELHLSGFMGGGDETTCYEAQAAYAATDHLGLMANFMTAKGGNVPSHNYGKGTFLEGALGYFKPAGKFGVFEIYGGVGGSRQHHEFYNSYYGESHGYADISYMRFFVQPSFGITTKLIDFGLSGRFCNMIYTRVDNLVHGDDYASSKLRDLQQMVPFNFEPAATLRIGWKNLKAQAQLEYAGLMNNNNSFLGEEWHMSLGISVSFSAKASSKNK